MNAKQAKRIRRTIGQALKMTVPERSDYSEDTTYIRGLVDSRRFTATVNGTEWESKALQIRVAPESFRGIYQRVKDRVIQANRSKERKRVLRSVQLRPEEVTGALEHSRAATVQREHSNVPVL